MVGPATGKRLSELIHRPIFSFDLPHLIQLQHNCGTASVIHVTTDYPVLHKQK